ncbi:hypothetical protein AB0J83_39660 [Actinoplanes sp. NPDC049596]|uniref:hypothetical protein n=1 Tax=unclassified Actinoplanes TaxID=2626549 RepID=UPI0034277EAA
MGGYAADMLWYEERHTVAVSPWMLPGTGGGTPCWQAASPGAQVAAVISGASAWLVVTLPGRSRIALRVAYCPRGHPRLAAADRAGDGARLQFESAIGVFRAEIGLPGPEGRPLHVTTALKPHVPLAMPFWPRDLAVLGQGRVYPRPSGLHFSVTDPGRDSVLYAQNLGALGDYARRTGTDLTGAVGGVWPELGLALPGSADGYLEPGRETVLSDAYLAFAAGVPDGEEAAAAQFLSLEALITAAV